MSTNSAQSTGHPSRSPKVSTRQLDALLRFFQPLLAIGFFEVETNKREWN